MWVLEHINKQLDKNKQALATKKCEVKFYLTHLSMTEVCGKILPHTFF